MTGSSGTRGTTRRTSRLFGRPFKFGLASRGDSALQPTARHRASAMPSPIAPKKRTVTRVAAPTSSIVTCISQRLPALRRAGKAAQMGRLWLVRPRRLTPEHLDKVVTVCRCGIPDLKCHGPLVVCCAATFNDDKGAHDVLRLALGVAGGISPCRQREQERVGLGSVRTRRLRTRTSSSMLSFQTDASLVRAVTGAHCPPIGRPNDVSNPAPEEGRRAGAARRRGSRLDGYSDRERPPVGRDGLWPQRPRCMPGVDLVDTEERRQSRQPSSPARAKLSAPAPARERR